MTPISPSQCKKFCDCPRKWAFQKIGRVPRIESQALADGKELHTHAERWLRDGIAPDQTRRMGALFAKGLHLYPAPGTVATEVTLTAELLGVPFLGILDVLDVAGVHDHKTIGNKKWALDANTLPRDIQAVSYAAMGCEALNVEFMRDRWVYFPKAGGNPWPVDVTLQWRESWAWLREVAGPLIVEIATQREAGAPFVGDIEYCNSHFPADPESCDFVGRFCDAVNVCSLTRKGEDMTPAEKVAQYRAQAAARAATGAPPAVATVPVQTTVAPPAVVAPVAAVAPPVAAPIAVAPPVAAAPVGAPVDVGALDTDELVGALNARGYAVTLVSAPG